MVKDISYFLKLDYPIKLMPIAEEDGGGWLAEIHELSGCIADGDTPEEAIQNLGPAKEAWLSVAMARGIYIPMPQKNSDDEFSGKFTLRIPKTIHRELAIKATEEGISLNQYVGNLISYQLGKSSPNPNVDYSQKIEEQLNLFYEKMVNYLQENESSAAMQNNVQVIQVTEKELLSGLLPELAKISKKHEHNQWRGLDQIFNGGTKRW